MTSTVTIVSGAPHGQAADSSGPQELLADIKKTKEKLEKLEQEIEKLNKRLDDSDFTATGRFSSAEKVEAELKDLKAEKARLQDLLVQLYRLTAQRQPQQQQQIGLGA